MMQYGILGALLGKADDGVHDAGTSTSSEVVLAYRAWRISGVHLVSCTCDCEWTPRERMTARCNNYIGHPRLPAWDCRCGFYAYKTELALAASEYVGLHGLTVRGRVAFWGRVIDHELGYRAEYAYPQVLYLRGDSYDEVIRHVADAYAVECMFR